ncbi:hypothetical protein ACKUV4_018315 [Acinetobacter baumannii]
MEAIISDSSLLIPLLENGGRRFLKWGNLMLLSVLAAIMSDDLVKSLAQAENLQLMDLQWQGVGEARLVNSVVPAIRRQ